MVEDDNAHCVGRSEKLSFLRLPSLPQVRSQFMLMDHLGVDKLYASVGASMGGMQSIAAGHMYPERVSRDSFTLSRDAFSS